MLDHKDAECFEDARPRLMGLAYRILGSKADAEDAVQDTYLRWAEADRVEIENATAWLTTVCARRCLDLLRSAHRSRVEYVGAWLPEPVQTSIDGDAEESLAASASLTTAFLLMLERLTPKERAAYLLREIFDMSYRDVADALEIQENTCRQLVSRAKSNVDQDKLRHTTPVERQEQLLAAFQTAVSSGTTASLASLLSNDIRLSADGGGKVPAILDVLRGRADVIGFLSGRLSKYWAGYHWRTANINGARGFLLDFDGVITAAVSFGFDETGKASDIFIMRNPDKLANLDAVALH